MKKILKSITLCLSLLYSLTGISQTFQSIDYIEKPFPSSVLTCEKFEMIFHIDRLVIDDRTFMVPAQNYFDPHNPNEVNMFVRFTNGTKTIDVNAFYDELVEEDPNFQNCQWGTGGTPISTKNFFPKAQYIKYRASATNTDPLSPNYGRNKGQRWIVRHAFRLFENGTWNAILYMRDKFSPTVPQYTSVPLGQIIVDFNTQSKGFVSKEQTSGNYLSTENGEMLFLLGMNENWSISDGDYLCRMKEIIKTSAKDNVNYFHVWLTSTNNRWSYIPGINGHTFCNSCNDDTPNDNEEFQSSVFNSKNAYKIDQYLDFADQYDTYIQLCLLINETTDELNSNNTLKHANYSRKNPYYVDNPNHIAMASMATVNFLNYSRFPNVGEPNINFTTTPGSTPQGPFAFFDASAGLKNRIKNVMRYCTARWGYARNLTAWEIGSEINIRENSVKVINPTDLANNVATPGFVTYNKPANYSALLTDWHNSVKNNILSNDANKHLITTNFTFGSDVFEPSNTTDLHVFPTYSNLDYSTAHYYFVDPRMPYDKVFDNTIGQYKFFNELGQQVTSGTIPEQKWIKYEKQEETIFRETRRVLNKIPKPFQVQEWGPGYQDPHGDPGNQLKNKFPTNYSASYAEMDPNGFLLHNVIFSSAFSGAMGTPMPYDLPFESIQPKNQYYHYRGLGNFFKLFSSVNTKLGSITAARFENNNTMWTTQQWRGTTHNYDANIEGLRYSYMKTSDGRILGWCQDKRMSFPNLFWDNKNYLKSLDRKDLVETMVPTTFTIKTDESIPFFFTVDWYDTREGQVIPDLSKIILSKLNSTTNEFELTIEFPGECYHSTFGDGMFVVKKLSSGSIDYTINTLSPVTISSPLVTQYTEDINVKLNCSKNIYKIELTINKVNSSGGSPQLLLSKQIMLNTVGGNEGKFELNEILRNNTALLYLPITGTGPDFYSVKIKNLDPDFTQAGATISPSEKTYFIKIINCTSTSELSVNGITGSSPSNPIQVKFAEPVMVDGRGSTGENGFRIIINEIDINGNLLNNEYNKLFNSIKCRTVFNANDIVTELQHANETFLPGDGPGDSRLWRIDFVTFNSYSPATGCSGWVTATEYVRVECGTNTDVQITNKSLNNGFYEYNYSEPLLIDPTQTRGETGFRVIIQECDQNKNLFGPETNISFSGMLDNIIDVNTIVSNNSGGAIPFLEPSSTGARYYKVKIAAFNYWSGGCDMWDEDFVWVKIKSCHLNNDFTLNNNSSYNTSLTPYEFDYNEPIIVGTSATYGETSHIIKLEGTVNGIAKSYSFSSNSKIQDGLSVSDYISQMPAYITEFKTNLPYPNTVWKITISLSNNTNAGGCDNNIEKSMYFKTVIDLDGGFEIIGSTYTYTSNASAGQTNYKELCNDEDVIIGNASDNKSETSYTITIDEVEWNGTNYVPFKRNYPIDHWNNAWTKSYTFKFYGTFSNTINISELIYKLSGYHFNTDLNSGIFYMISVKKSGWLSSGATHQLVFKFKDCSLPPLSGSNIRDDENNVQQDNAQKMKEKNSTVLLTLYPNPTDGIFRISSLNGNSVKFETVRISTTMGQMVYEGNNKNSDEEYNMSHLSSGLYLVEVVLNGKKQTFKFIKQ